MGFDVKRYEGQIRAILQAPGVDLSTISAKRVRKQLLESNPELTPELVKEKKEDIDTLIGQVYEQVSAGAEAVEEEEEHDKRKREDDGSEALPVVKKPKKEPKQEAYLSDAEIARQLSNELNRSTRVASSSAKPKTKAKRERKTKSAATVDSDGEGTSVADGAEKPKRKGGFTKEYALSEPLADLLSIEKLSRPQVVKRIWDYIKEKGLQNPNDKREILCDDRMKSIFAVEKLNMFKMNKQLGEHLYEPAAA
ncbi:SWIB/MDM2 domain-containing protein [Cytidiella melzeri]|nr:SWIB/MDM2 domain-containing protein [Cytidiella melzeri]